MLNGQFSDYFKQYPNTIILNVYILLEHKSSELNRHYKLSTVVVYTYIMRDNL